MYEVWCRYEDGYIIPHYFSDRNKAFRYASKRICFSDADPYYLEEIYIKAKEERYTYAGWQPGMVYEWINSQGKTEWIEEFPEWDH